MVLVATTALAALSAAAEIGVSQTTGFDAEHSWFRYTPYTKYRDMSGITWAGGNKFYVIRNDNHLSVMTVSLDSKGNLTALPSMTEGYPLEGAGDPEGIAYDNASGKVWVSDENGPAIREYDPVNTNGNGRFVRTGRQVSIPPILRRTGEDNRSLESLTISGDGLVMWTANEEALEDDTYTYRVVRLVKFVRKTVQSEWSLDGMWAYECDDPYALIVEANGVADLLSLPDGSLVVMERSVDSSTWGECRLYKVDFSNATDVTNVNSIDRSAITDGSVKLVGKSELLIFSDGGRPEVTHIDDCDGNGKSGCMVACYEGICLGPKNKDGSYNIMLVSDGGAKKHSAYMQPFVRALKLTGLDICTLKVKRDTVEGLSGFVEDNYRFTTNSIVTMHHVGEGIGERPYTNKEEKVFSSSWRLDKKGTSGTGTTATFKLTQDDTLIWSIKPVSNVQTPIFGIDTFEKYAPNTVGSSIDKWSGKGVIVEQPYSPPEDKYILNGEHKNVIDAEDGATRKLSEMKLKDSKSHRMDMMVEVQRPRGGLPTTMPGNLKFAIAADKDGCLNIWHNAIGTVYDPLLRGNVLVRENRWNQLSGTKYADGAWVHVSAEFRYTGNGAFCRVWLDGVECNNVYGGKATATPPIYIFDRGPWVTLPSSSAPTSLVLKGTRADDLIVATPEFIQSLPASASIMVSPSAVSGASAAGGQAYTVSTAVAAPAAAPAPASSAPSAAQMSQSAVAAPAIVGFGIAPTKRPQIRFTGYAEGVEYRVVCSSTVDFRNASVIDGEIVKVQTGDDGVSVVATWEGAEPSDPASGAKFYRVEVVEAAVE